MGVGDDLLEALQTGMVVPIRDDHALGGAMPLRGVSEKILSKIIR